MSTLRSYVIDASKPVYLRVGVKWEPLERDTIGEDHVFVSEEDVRQRLADIPKRLKKLEARAKLLRASYFFRKRAERLQYDREHILYRAKALKKYLEQVNLKSFDLDLCCFCYGEDNKLVGFVTPEITIMNGTAQFHPAFLHSGDDKTGTGDGADEEMLINLHVVDTSIRQFFVIIVSHNHTFDEVKGSAWSIVNTKQEKALLSGDMNITEKHHVYVMAKMTRTGPAWTMEKAAMTFPLEKKEVMPLQDQIDRALTASFFPGGVD